MSLKEAAVEHLKRWRRRQRNARELDSLNRHAEDLNREAADALAYQIEP